MCNQALTICANKYIFILNIYTHFYKYKCSNYKLLNVTVSENINICKPSMYGPSRFGLRIYIELLINYGSYVDYTVYIFKCTDVCVMRLRAFVRPMSLAHLINIHL